jgi:hypothetical protein
MGRLAGAPLADVIDAAVDAAAVAVADCRRLCRLWLLTFRLPGCRLLLRPLPLPPLPPGWCQLVLAGVAGAGGRWCRWRLEFAPG